MCWRAVEAWQPKQGTHMASWGPTAVLLVVLPLVPAPGLAGAVADDSEWVKLPSKCEGEKGGGEGGMEK